MHSYEEQVPLLPIYTKNEPSAVYEQGWRRIQSN